MAIYPLMGLVVRTPARRDPGSPCPPSGYSVSLSERILLPGGGSKSNDFGLPSGRKHDRDDDPGPRPDKTDQAAHRRRTASRPDPHLRRQSRALPQRSTKPSTPKSMSADERRT
jgi:hypothetical protein